MANFIAHNTPATNANTNGVEYTQPDAFLNIDFEYDDGSTEALNYYEKRNGDFKEIGIKLYKDVPLHKILMDILDANPEKAQEIVKRLKITYGKKQDKSNKERGVTL